MRKAYYWIFGIGLFIVIIGIIGIPSEPETDTSVGNVEKYEAKQSEPEEEIIKIAAIQLSSEYNANEVKADELYKGKNLEVTGTVSKIQKDVFDDVQVLLITENQFIEVVSYVKDSEKNKVMELGVGDQVTMRCKGGGKLVFLVLKDCIIK